MAQVLVLVEHSEGVVKKVSLELLTMAAAVGEPAAVFIGAGIDAAADKLAEYGAAKVYVIEGAEYAVLNSCRSLDRVGAIVGEYHRASGVTPEAFFELLRDFDVNARDVSGPACEFVAMRRAA